MILEMRTFIVNRSESNVMQTVQPSIMMILETRTIIVTCGESNTAHAIVIQHTRSHHITLSLVYRCNAHTINDLWDTFSTTLLSWNARDLITQRLSLVCRCGTLRQSPLRGSCNTFSAMLLSCDARDLVMLSPEYRCDTQTSVSRCMCSVSIWCSMNVTVCCRMTLMCDLSVLIWSFWHSTRFFRLWFSVNSLSRVYGGWRWDIQFCKNGDYNSEIHTRNKVAKATARHRPFSCDSWHWHFYCYEWKWK